jgi:putative transcriptional regulator
VTVVSVPRVQNGGSSAVDRETLVELAADHDLVVTAGTEALVAGRRAGLEPDARFGTPAAVQEAATKGLDVLLLSSTSELSAHTDRLREHNITYEVLDTSTD